MANTGEQGYLDLLKDILDNGVDRGDRTGTGTRGVFGRQIRFNLNEGFPLLTTKKVFLRGIIEELLWFLRGSTNAKELEDKNVNIWKAWGDPETRELGPVYGKQWRNWESPIEHFVTNRDGDRMSAGQFTKHVDQIKDLVERLKADPNSRRHIVVAWNPGEIEYMALPPCHCLFQFFVADGKLSCQLYQRSADVFLGVPFNIASYALLTMMIAQQCDLELGEFVHTFGDVHIYNDHMEQVNLQLTRNPYAFPTMNIEKAQDIFSYTIDSFQLEGYECHPIIKADVSA
jgi:thymidylate synthase